MTVKYMYFYMKSKMRRTASPRYLISSAELVGYIVNFDRLYDLDTITTLAIPHKTSFLPERKIRPLTLEDN